MEKLHYLYLSKYLHTYFCASRTPCPEKASICLIFNIPWLLPLILTLILMALAIINKLLIEIKTVCCRARLYRPAFESAEAPRA